MSSDAIDNLIKSIETFVEETGDVYLSLRAIAEHGWLIGAKYATVKKMVDSGLIKSFSLNLGSTKRNPIKKVHYKDLENYLVENYKN